MDGFNGFTQAPRPSGNNQFGAQYQSPYIPPLNSQAGMVASGTMPTSLYGGFTARPVGISQPQTRPVEDPVEAAKHRQFMEQQRKMKDFGALTKTQIDADSYAKSLFGPFGGNSESNSAAKVGQFDVATNMSALAETPAIRPCSPPVAASINVQRISSPVQLQSQVQVAAPAPPKKSLEEVMLSMCEIKQEPKPNSQTNVIANKSRGKEQLRQQIPFWLTDEGIVSLPPLYHQLLQHVCSDTPDGLPNLQKVFTAFANFGVDQSRISSIILLTRRSLPNGLMTRREFIEALALVILTRQGIRCGVDYLNQLSSAPVPAQPTAPSFAPGTMLPTASASLNVVELAPFSQQQKQNPVVTTSFTAFTDIAKPPNTIAPSDVDNDFGDDDFQSFQSVGAVSSKHSLPPPPPVPSQVSTTIIQGSISPVSSQLAQASPLPPLDDRNSLSSDKYAAFRDLETTPEPEISLQPFSPSVLSKQEVEEAEIPKIVEKADSKLPVLSNQLVKPQVVSVGIVATAKVADEDDWADFTAVSFPGYQSSKKPPPQQDTFATFTFSSTATANQISNITISPPPAIDASISKPHAQSQSTVLATDSDLDIWKDEAISMPSSVPTPVRVTSPPKLHLAPSQPVPSTTQVGNVEISLNYEVSRSSSLPEDSSQSKVQATTIGSSYLSSSGSVVSRPGFTANYDAFREVTPDVAAFADEPPTPPPPSSPAPPPKSPLFEETLTTSIVPFRTNSNANGGNVQPISDSTGNDGDSDFFASLEMPPPTIVPRTESSDQLNRTQDSSPSLRNMNAAETSSVSSLDLGKLPNDNPPLPVLNNNSPVPTTSPPNFGISMTPEITTNKQETKQSNDEFENEDFGDFSHADSLNFSSCPPAEVPPSSDSQANGGGGLAEFQSMQFDATFSSPDNGSANKSRMKTVPSFSVFDDDIPEVSLAPPLFSSPFNSPNKSAAAADSVMTPSDIFKRCVQAACDILHQSVTAFQNAKHGDDAVMEAMCTKKGRAFISSIREVREIVRRLKVALPCTIGDGDQSLASVLEVFVHFETMWSSFLDLLPQHIADVLIHSNNVSSGSGTPLQTPAVSNGTICSFCLGAFTGNNDPPMTVIALKNKRGETEQFHVVCANFWANCVETSSKSEQIEIPNLFQTQHDHQQHVQ